MTAAVAVPRHGDFYYLRRKSRQIQPPGRGESARGCTRSVTPHCSTYSGRVGERPVVDEEDTARTSSPVTITDTPFHGVVAQSQRVRLSHGDNAVVATKKVIEHLRSDAGQAAQVPFDAISARFSEVGPELRAKIAICGGRLRCAIRGSRGR